MNAPQNIPSSAPSASIPSPQVPQMAMGGVPPQAPPPPPMNPNFENGGDMGASPKSNPLKDFFSGINIIEAGILALGVATFLYAIHYYKFEMQLSKTGYADLNGRMQKLESDMEKKEREANANAQNGSRKPMMGKRIMF